MLKIPLLKVCNQLLDIMLTNWRNNKQFPDMSFELGENQLSTLGLIVGFNKSDSTYGWNGYLGGMKRFKIQMIEIEMYIVKWPSDRCISLYPILNCRQTLFYSHIYDDVVEGLIQQFAIFQIVKVTFWIIKRNSFNTANSRIDASCLSSEYSENLSRKTVYRMCSDPGLP